MDLKQVFIGNLRNFRSNRGISQMKLAEMCNTATNYIGEIEIGRRFPSLKLIEKIGQALEIEPYLFFIEENGKNYHELNDIIDMLIKLPDQIKLNVINRISTPWEPTGSTNK
ncbi:MAG: helix-turn-helix transcriptional regulator [Treponema sp.]|jgi:transcriptional regulator with XRE-family HTH domain|nr:helix-turn-helix transcriptional regulator [Treponema sp.]